ncbi:MAG: TetR/AcrR family transcriptional regulator [Myxococcota bacterium]|nr:TetR/AcrR family transcriptional regulator [Myxococcota bacterium]
MPKAPMSREEVESTRAKILDTALDIIINEGFSNLSIRNIAARLGVTATTIYNYYANKDELNLMIRVRGFETLYDLLIERSSPFEDIDLRFAAMIRAYVAFGLTYPSYYDIMFNLNTPKYLDYVGTAIESVAYHEKQTALKCLELFAQPIRSYLHDDGEMDDQFILYQVVKFWSDLHGLIALCNSRLFHEVLDDVEAFVEERISDLIADLLQIKQRIDAGEAISKPKTKSR